MSVITFGNAKLEYRIRYSSKAKRKRIEITPFSIELIVPESTSHEEISSFMKTKAKEIFVSQEKLKAKSKSFFQERDQYFSGGKVSFRGRRLAVWVEYGAVDESVVSYKSRFYITLPMTVAEDEKELVVGRVVREWLRARLLQDSIEIANELGKPLSLSFKSVRVREQKHIWATCGKDGILYINFLLIRVPRKALEYVIAHELAHLTHRNHSEKFWALVGKMVPGFIDYQNMLDGMG
jgi:predicted metal-dependent hydrolase